ncbi:hypothetical protein T01_1135 [Trichinella spiralis]|uniref:Uncharacterized protein n=1 Tax=Trichinella spiralis TaxID=6334 RepID=A0A0V0YYK2_TRISP|nr:hypothetical protein T01_1135 [Trichinella spiralis]
MGWGGVRVWMMNRRYTEKCHSLDIASLLSFYYC